MILHFQYNKMKIRITPPLCGEAVERGGKRSEAGVSLPGFAISFL